jgi:hypothetical protein
MQRKGESQRWASLCALRRQRIQGELTMSKIGDKLRMSLQKREDALNRFKTREKEFHQSKKEILRDIEEARTIWLKTLEQIPNPDFNQ